MRLVNIDLDPSCELYSGWEGTIPEFIDVLKEKLEQVPPEFQGDTTFTIEGGYEGEVIVGVGYSRPQTAAEIEEERARAERYHIEQEQRDMREFMRLKSKFEPK